MSPLRIAAAVAALVVALPAAAGADGYSLDEAWNGWWRRIFDRSGRPDPDGPLQQRYAGKLYEEYDLNLEVPRFPMRFERAWADDPSIARASLQSLNEFDLASITQLKNRVAMSKSWQLGIAYDHLQNRVSDSDMVRLDFHYRPAGTAAPYVVLSAHPRYTKIDIELIAAAGYRHDRWGDARVRVFALDVFNDFSHALARSRDRQRDVALNQRDVPLAGAFELATAERGRVRGELYAGGILPQATTYAFADPELLDFRQTHSGVLGGALVEWHAAERWRLGATALAVRTRTQREHAADPGADRDTRERTHRLRAYALATPVDPLQLEVFVRWTDRSERDVGLAIDDREWMGSARGEWMFSDVAGVELGFLATDRDVEAPPELDLDLGGTRVRVLNRAVLDFGKVWVATGFAVDLYAPGKGPFGGVSFTMIADLP